MPDAIAMLHEDHQKVQRLFKEFEETEDHAKQQRIAEQAMTELKVHSKLEEEIFYPAMRRQSQDLELMSEAKEEHHVVDVLMEELQELPADNEQYAAKFTVLAENVRHHIKEEETEMFPKARKAGLDLEALGQEMAARKPELAGTFEAAKSTAAPRRRRPRRAKAHA